MASTASGSSHSSCGGTGDDDEFNSRAPPDTISSFLYNFPPPQLPQTSHSIYDPLPTATNTWALIHRNPPPPPSTASNCNVDTPLAVPSIFPSSSSPQPPASPRASKKRPRSRASLHAPTTVLITDTSNFRAMVEEFTGIPMPSFLTSSRPRINLLQTTATASPTLYPLGPKLRHTGSSTSSSSQGFGNSENALLSSSILQIPNLSNSQNKAVDLDSLIQYQQPGVTVPKINPAAMFQWPRG